MKRFKTALANLSTLIAVTILVSISLVSANASAQVAIEDIGFVTLPGDQFQIELMFNGRPPEPEVFEISSPARLSIDFENVTSQLASRRYPLEYRNADSVVVLESQGRTRMVVNLENPTAYSASVQGNSVMIVVGDDANERSGVLATSSSQRAVISSANEDIRNIDFRRGENGSGQIIVELGNSGLIGNVSRAGSRLELEFTNASLADELEVRQDVVDFATPVQFIESYAQNDDVIIQSSIEGDFDYIAYQLDDQYILSISPVGGMTLPGGNGTSEREFGYTGERISPNFQNIEVRTVLYLLAEFSDFNLVVSDNVVGNITLRVSDVPWDQVLDMVLRQRGLDKRQDGNVIYVAPADEIASAELLALENSEQARSLSPLVTEYIEMNYAVAVDIAELLNGDDQQSGSSGNGSSSDERRTSILSDRGSASAYEPTNTLIVQDAAANIQQVREMLEQLDVPVRQVLIEARIVNASTNFGEALGIQWGGNYTPSGTGDQFIVGGSMASNIEQSTAIAEYNIAIAEAVQGGATLAEALATTVFESVTFPGALNVDLGVDNPNSSIALGFAGNSGLLQLELSALESSGNGEVIAQPRVMTQDQQQAIIESGIQVPYQAQAGGTAGGSTTEFIPAVLSLDVTPQITPDNKIIMMLNIHQDSVIPGAGATPAIATNALTSRVLVDDGDTIVLGGVFREELTTTISKTPVLGDIPYVGNLFKRTENNETKTELLIFITPSIIDELM